MCYKCSFMLLLIDVAKVELFTASINLTSSFIKDMVENSIKI